MNPLYLAQTNVQVTDANFRGTLSNDGRNIDVILLNKGKAFLVTLEYKMYGRNAQVYATADFQGRDKKNLITWSND